MPLRRVVVAQDTGGAIKGPVRWRFFLGLLARMPELRQG